MRVKFCNLVGVRIPGPFGYIYGRVMEMRNGLYDRGIFTVHPLGARTMSIGNLTAGGTGKTPLVALTAGILAENGEKVCVLTRGYGRRNEGERVIVSDGEKVLAAADAGGDEPVELALKLLGKAVVIADADRVRAAAWAKERFGITVFVLDDAFQHRRAARDVDIVCIDATNPFGNGHILPSGTLREPLSGLRRASAAVLTRSHLVPSTTPVIDKISSINAGLPIYNARNKIASVTPLEEYLAAGTGRTDQQPRPTGYFAFCGLGNPGNFWLQLEIDGFQIAGKRSFGDHHRYSQADAAELSKEAGSLGAAGLITTAKDAVKLAGLGFGLPVYVAQAAMILDNEAGFARLLTSSS